MPPGEFASVARRLPRLLGDLLVAPARALSEIDNQERGGFAVLVAWCLAAAFGLRFVNLADAVVGFEAGGGLRVLSVLVGELTQAIPAALGAAVAVVVFAGEKRDPSIDLEMGCAAAIPFVVARAAFRTAVIVIGREPPTFMVEGSYVIAGAWTLVLVAIAVRIARSRPHARVSDATPSQRLRSRLASWTAIGVLGVGLAGSALWTARNAGSLGPVARGGPAPNFTLPRVDGKPGTLSLSSFRGQVVVLDFWATWCPPCLASLPMMHDLSTVLTPKGVTFIGVDSEGAQTSPGEVTNFLAQHGAPYPVVYDDGTANELYRIKVLPTIVIVGRDGLVDRVFMGSSSRNALMTAIEAAAAR